MHSTQPTQLENNTQQPAAIMLKQPEAVTIQPPAKKPRTFGQQLADKMASKVGS